MSGDERPRSHERWAHLRFGVVGGLLASPPAPGELRAELSRLAEKPWRHPTTGELVRFGLSTIERWYYAARAGSNPVGVLRRKLRGDSGRSLAITDELAQALRRQHKEHPSWSYKLHLDNLAVRIALDPDLGAAPSYPTLRRFMAAQGLLRQRRRRGRQEREGEIRAREHLAGREVRSFESEYVSGLWHLDFHHGSLKVLRPQAEWVTPILLAILDDRSRLICHAQWYLDETAESLIHGLTQAFLKRGLPRALLTDNGSAMIATETTEGLTRLSVTHRTTLPYSPYQYVAAPVMSSRVARRPAIASSAWVLQHITSRLQRTQKRHQGGLLTPRLAARMLVGDGTRSQRPGLGVQINLGVDVGGVEANVTQPAADGIDVNAGTQQM